MILFLLLDHPHCKKRCFTIAVNWNNIALSHLVGLFPLLLAFIFSLKEYRSKKQPIYLIMFGTWLSFFCAYVSLIFSEVFLSLFLHFLGGLLLLLAGYFILYLTDFISNPSVKIKMFKYSIMILLSVFLILFACEPDGAYIGIRADGSPSVISSGGYRYTAMLLMGYGHTAISWYWIRIYINAPKSMKKIAFGNLIGGLLAGIGTGLLYILGFSIKYPGSVNMVFSIGVFIITYSFTKDRRLAFILPFKVYSLYVLDWKKGVSFFSYHWLDKGKEVLRINEFNNQYSNLDSSLYATQAYMNQILGNYGLIELIETEELSCLFCFKTLETPVEKIYTLPNIRNHQKLKENLKKRRDNITIAAILIISNVTDKIKEALTKFMDAFIEHFGDPIREGETDVLDHYQDATPLLEEYFSFIPS